MIRQEIDSPVAKNESELLRDIRNVLNTLPLQRKLLIMI